MSKRTQMVITTALVTINAHTYSADSDAPAVEWERSHETQVREREQAMRDLEDMVARSLPKATPEMVRYFMQGARTTTTRYWTRAEGSQP